MAQLNGLDLETKKITIEKKNNKIWQLCKTNPSGSILRDADIELAGVASDDKHGAIGLSCSNHQLLSAYLQGCRTLSPSRAPSGPDVMRSASRNAPAATIDSDAEQNSKNMSDVSRM